MKKFWIIVVFAFLVMLLPFAGFSPSFDAKLQFIFGLVILIAAFLAARDNFFDNQNKTIHNEPVKNDNYTEDVVSPIDQKDLEEIVR